MGRSRKPAPNSPSSGNNQPPGAANNPPTSHDDTLNQLKTDIAEIRQEIEDLKNNPTGDMQDDSTGITVAAKLGTLEKKLDTIEQTAQYLTSSLRIMGQKYKDLQEKCISIESHSRRNNLLFDGIPEEKKEDCEAKVKDVLKNNMELENVDDIQIVRCHRLGPAQRNNSQRPRTMIMKFQWYSDRASVWSNRKSFKNTNYFLSEDFPKEIVARRRTLLPIMKKAFDMDKQAYINVDKLVIDGRQYTVDTLHQLPKELHPYSITTKCSDSVIAFCNEHSPLSNFHKCDIRSQNQVFHSVEQGHQYRKACHHQDEVRATKIMVAETPLDCKRIGDSIKTEGSNWHSVQEESMKELLIAKFTQHKHLKQYLVGTGEKQLGEATKDMFWGVGLTVKDENILNQGHWIGQNRLGSLLKEVREGLT
jgi:ribA/ribD-fused uncharacterized protein